MRFAARREPAHKCTRTNDFKNSVCKIDIVGESTLSNLKWVVCIDVSGSTNDIFDNKKVLSFGDNVEFIERKKYIIENFGP